MARTGLAFLIAVLSAPSCWACSVPLFRYALERWPPAPYELVVFHRGPLNAADRDRVRVVRESSRHANLKVTTADLAGQVGSDLAAVWAREPAASPLPRAVLRYPDSRPETPAVWSGPLANTPVQTW